METCLKEEIIGLLSDKVLHLIQMNHIVNYHIENQNGSQIQPEDKGEGVLLVQAAEAGVPRHRDQRLPRRSMLILLPMAPEPESQAI